MVAARHMGTRLWPQQSAELKQQNQEFETSLGYNSMILSQKQTNKQTGQKPKLLSLPVTGFGLSLSTIIH